jgi:DNA repair protein RadC
LKIIDFDTLRQLYPKTLKYLDNVFPIDAAKNCKFKIENENTDEFSIIFLDKDDVIRYTKRLDWHSIDANEVDLEGLL